jgi:hypothetical protein
VSGTAANCPVVSVDLPRTTRRQMTFRGYSVLASRNLWSLGATVLPGASIARKGTVRTSLARRKHSWTKRRPIVQPQTHLHHTTGGASSKDASAASMCASGPEGQALAVQGLQYRQRRARDEVSTCNN